MKFEKLWTTCDMYQAESPICLKLVTIKYHEFFFNSAKIQPTIFNSKKKKSNQKNTLSKWSKRLDVVTKIMNLAILRGWWFIYCLIDSGRELLHWLQQYFYEILFLLICYPSNMSCGFFFSLTACSMTVIIESLLE